MSFNPRAERIAFFSLDFSEVAIVIGRLVFFLLSSLFVFEHCMRRVILGCIMVVILAGLLLHEIRTSVLATPASVSVQVHLAFLGQAMSMHAQTRGRVDWPSLDAMQADVKAGGYYPIPPRFQHGFDIWGSKIVLIKDEETKRWILRSYGPNRRDDNGEGDDIQQDSRGTW